MGEYGIPEELKKRAENAPSMFMAPPPSDQDTDKEEAAEDVSAEPADTVTEGKETQDRTPEQVLEKVAEEKGEEWVQDNRAHILRQARLVGTIKELPEDLQG